MGLFSQRSAAFCWDKHGSCFGLLLCRDGQKYKVLNSWSKVASSSELIADTIQQGYKELGVKEDDYVTAGELGMRCSFSDLMTPQMKDKDLQNSLSFSMANHFPLDAADLHWGYRILKSVKGEALLPVRLAALKKGLWNEWLGHIGSLKIDQLISPAAVADAVLDEAIYIPLNSEKGFLLEKNEEGLFHAQNINQTEVDEDVFGAGKLGLKHDKINCSALNKLPLPQQQSFAQVILLALYGLSPLLKKDKETLFQLPQSVKPKRNIFVRTACMLCTVYLVMLGIYHYSRYLAKKKNEVRSISRKIDDLNRKIKRNTTPEKNAQALKDLYAEITENTDKPLGIKNLLSIISSKLPKEYYLKDFYAATTQVRCRILVNPEYPEYEFPDTAQLFSIFREIEIFDKDIDIAERNNEITMTLKFAKPEEESKEIK